MSFSNAVKNCAQIGGCLERGMKALGSDSSYIRASQSTEGSVDIDTCLCRSLPNEHRWDYIIGYKGRAIMVEVHPATDGEVKKMIEKATWLRKWLRTNATAIEAIEVRPYFWVASGKVAILRTSPQARRLAGMSISFPRRVLDLDKPF